MQRHKHIVPKQLPFKWVYGIIALLLFIAFAGRVSVICINGGTGLVKSQQVITEDNQEQNDKQEESKFDSKQLTEFISPAYIEMPCLTITAHLVSHPAYLSVYVKVPLITVIAPPPDLIIA